MLVLSRKTNEAIVINDTVRVTVLAIKGDRVRLGIEAPAEVTDCCHRSDGVKQKPAAPTPEPAKPLKACCRQPDTCNRVLP